jgi:hypothetical protein
VAVERLHGAQRDFGGSVAQSERDDHRRRRRHPDQRHHEPGHTGAGFSIGALADGTRPFTGELDEVSVYTADISGATPAGHWAAGRRPTSDVVTGLTSRTAFDRLGRATDA